MYRRQGWCRGGRASKRALTVTTGLEIHASCQDHLGGHSPLCLFPGVDGRVLDEIRVVDESGMAGLRYGGEAVHDPLLLTEMLQYLIICQLCVPQCEDLTRHTCTLHAGILLSAVKPPATPRIFAAVVEPMSAERLGARADIRERT